jgi:hypothetical protein
MRLIALNGRTAHTCNSMSYRNQKMIVSRYPLPTETCREDSNPIPPAYLS